MSVVVPTYRRPEFVRECLRHLSALRTPPTEALVVDASPDDRTRAVVGEWPGVTYLRNDLGASTTPESRNIGLQAATGDVVAFVDDDAYVDPDWLDELISCYADPEVFGVGGRIVNGQSGEDREGLDRIGRLLPDGRLMGYFAADPGRVIDVDHLLGANMSFRRAALSDVGGVHGGYPGPCICEETDISLRQRALGRRLVFNPRAVVRHVSAPYAIKGDRFDRRWHFYARRNQQAMFIRVFGLGSPYPARLAGTLLRELKMRCAYVARALAGRVPELDHRGRLRSPAIVLRSVIELSGLVVGTAAGIPQRRSELQEKQ
ncbi:glycosyltransferase [Isoptericola chiayiensis]|uniref:glycosyltransferase n=1 Tax=Isoptericola chiayiensis TaxID=579446 RepID=UPI00155379C6|nr:GT2 family glycosyltransferase [Isoptericola chiayiensis]